MVSNDFENILLQVWHFLVESHCDKIEAFFSPRFFSLIIFLHDIPKDINQKNYQQRFSFLTLSSSTTLSCMLSNYFILLCFIGSCVKHFSCPHIISFPWFEANRSCYYLWMPNPLWFIVLNLYYNFTTCLVVLAMSSPGHWFLFFSHANAFRIQMHHDVPNILSFLEKDIGLLTNFSYMFMVFLPRRSACLIN